jgi:hypothetical protein
METRDLVAVMGVVRREQLHQLGSLTAKVKEAVDTYYDPPGGLDIE